MINSHISGDVMIKIMCADKKRTVCFTGHRWKKLPFKNENDIRCTALKKQLQETVIELIENQGITHFISGMALGVDMIAAEIVLALKSTYPYITLEAALYCPEQSERWREENKSRFKKILERCDKVTPVSDFYSNGCEQKRNIYMVDCSSNVIAIWDGTRSGTGNTVRYARSTNTAVVIINPQNL